MAIYQRKKPFDLPRAKPHPTPISYPPLRLPHQANKTIPYFLLIIINKFYLINIKLLSYLHTNVIVDRIIEYLCIKLVRLRDEQVTEKKKLIFFTKKVWDVSTTMNYL